VARAKKGETKRFFNTPRRCTQVSSSEQKVGGSVLIYGLYTTIRPLRQFDSLVFLARPTGATFTASLRRGIVQ
jgi:hypothetical protein